MMEAIIKRPVPDYQGELIRRYCSEGELLVQSAVNIQQAKQRAGQVCARFERECDSELVFDAVRMYMDGIIARMFPTQSEQQRSDLQH